MDVDRSRHPPIYDFSAELSKAQLEESHLALQFSTFSALV